MRQPEVSILMPAQDEASDIDRSIAALLAQDVPLADLELLVIDGGSSDGTAEQVAELLSGCGLARWEVLTNPSGTTPSNLNVGLAEARGRIICRVDARSVVPSHYVRRCVEVLDGRPDVAVVGGAQVALPRDASTTAVGIARALNNRWGMGLSRYRRGAASGPADTVYLGAFRTTELRAAGGWDERFPTNQDFELNRRMGRTGLVWFDAGSQVGYLPRSTVSELFRQYRRFGEWKVRYWRTTGDRPRPRQIVLLVAPAAGALLLSVACASVPKRWRLLILGGGLLSVIAGEVTGADEPPGGIASRAIAVSASAAIAGGWSVGAWGSLLHRSPNARRSRS